MPHIYYKYNFLAIGINMNVFSGLHHQRRVIHLKDVSLDEPRSKVGGESSEESVWDKLPQEYYGLDSWPTKTNLLCWHCGLSFDSVPVFVPREMPASQHIFMRTHGIFCHFSCAQAYIENNYTYNECWGKTQLLKLLYEDMRQRRVKIIFPAPDKYGIVCYGGPTSIEKFRSLQSTLIIEE